MLRPDDGLALPQRLELAALLMVRTDRGFDVRTTRQFDVLANTRD